MNVKPKRTLIAYCVLAERLRTPGVSPIQALSPFFAEACQEFAGQLFDAEKFSDAVASRFFIRIPRLAALGLAEQLAAEGVLIPDSRHGSSIIYRYSTAPPPFDAVLASPVTETEVEGVLASFVAYCRMDDYFSSTDESSLQQAFLDRLLNIDSMHILGRKEASITAKKSADTIVLNKFSNSQDKPDRAELHLDFLVSRYLLDLRNTNAAGFERVSNVAFANMAAEAIACFRDPPSAGDSLSTLTVYLDSPLLLDMLGVNTDYAIYGQELLESIRASGAQAAVFDHCVNEAEGAVLAQLTYLRSGVNKLQSSWGTTAAPDLLAALIGNIGDRAEKRLGIAVHRDPEVNLHRRSPSVVGDIEAEMERRMQGGWRKTEAKDYDRKSVWAMLAIRQTIKPHTRICDSEWLLLTRNTPLARIANDAWGIWLNGTTKFSKMHIARWVPLAMSDKQFAGYLWARSGGGAGAISNSRLLSYCSAAVRPRADVKARAYNLVLELSGQDQADDIAALIEDREAGVALMRATKGDPEDVTPGRLPFIIEKMKLAAGEFAAASVREEGEQKLEAERLAHAQKLAEQQQSAMEAQQALATRNQEAQAELVQQQQDRQALEARNIALQEALETQSSSERDRRQRILKEGFKSGLSLYRRFRWAVAVLFGISIFFVAWLSSVNPTLSATLSALLGIAGFWFVPDILHKPMDWLAMKRLRSVVASKEAGIEVPTKLPDFKAGVWAIDD